MAKRVVIRRSVRLIAQKVTYQTASKSSIQKHKDKSRKTSNASVSSFDMDAIDVEISENLKKAKKDKQIAKPVLADSASASEAFTEDEDSEDEYSEYSSLYAHEYKFFSAEGLYTTGHSSYDSRYKPGYEDFVIHDFVVVKMKRLRPRIIIMRARVKRTE